MPPARSARSVAASGLAGWLELGGGAGPLAAPNAVELDVPDVCRPAEAHLLYASFSAGCFWGLQRALDGTPGVVRSATGYSQGRAVRPTYRLVCGGRSGHAETVRATYDPRTVSYAQLLDAWWSCVEDPTDRRGQGPDRGPQYRLGVFWHHAQQRDAAAAFLAAQAAALRRTLAVELKPAAPFTEAEECHQRYFAQGGLDPRPETPFWMGQYID